MSRVIVFFVSGHGFGHASRDIEVINAIRALAPHADVIVRTAASRWLFELTLRTSGEVHAIECDTGVVQLDSLRPDLDATLARAAAFYADWPALVQREADFLRHARADLVVADIPPLGCAAAHAADIQAVALGNFTWDWIYEDYLSREQVEPDFLSVIRSAYRTATQVLRLPMSGGFAAMDPSVINDVPLVARHARHAPEDTRSALGLPLGLPLVLMSFGGYGLEGFSIEGLDLSGYGVVTTRQVGVRPQQQHHRQAAVFTIDEGALYRAGFRYEDLVAACEAVVSKPGYGIVAECAANGAALLYTSRGQFAEYDVLVSSMPAFVRSRFIPQDDLIAGRWQRHLDALLSQPRPATHAATNGAEVVADLVLKYLH
jgi:hypothetical protein